MDKYEYRVKTEQMLGYFDKKQYKKAMEIADTIDWRRVKNTSMLNSVSEIYELSGEFQKSRDILFIAYNRSPESKKIVYRLGTLALKINDTGEASDCYEEFVKIAPKDPNQYILKYKILKAQGAPLTEQIAALSDFKKAEYIEKWAYELAKLYHEAGMTTECLEECDDLILWFSEGKYVFQAMELKMKYRPLTPLQQEKYDEYCAKKGIHGKRPQAVVRPVPKQEAKAAAKTGAAKAALARTAVFDEIPEDVKESEDADTGAGETRRFPTGELHKALDALEAKKAQASAEETAPSMEIPQPVVSEEQEPAAGETEVHTGKKSAITRVVKGATLEEALSNVVAINREEQRKMELREEQIRISGQMRIDDILQEWEEKQKVNAEAIAEQKEKDEKRLREEREALEARREAERIAEEKREAEEVAKHKAKEPAKSRNAVKIARKAPVLSDDIRQLVEELEGKVSEEAEYEEPEELGGDEDIVEEDSYQMELEFLEDDDESEDDDSDDDETEAGEAEAEEEIEADETEETEPEEAEAEEEELEEAETEEAEFEETEIEEEPEADEDFKEAEEAADEEDFAEEVEELEEDDFEEDEFEEEEDDFEEDEFEEEDEEDFEEDEFEEEDEEDFEEDEFEEEDEEDFEEDEFEEEDEDDFEEDEFEEEEDDFEEDEFEEEEDDFEEDEFEEEEDDFEEDEFEEEDEEDFEEDEFEEEDEEDFEEDEFEEEEKEEPLEIEEPTEEEIQKRIKKSKGNGVPFDTGFVVTGRYDLSATSEIGLKAGLTEEQKRLFSYFVPVRGMSEQIVEVLDNDRRARREGTSRTGNLLVIGRKGSGKTVLAVDIVKAIQKQRNLKQGKVAIVTGESLNKKELTNIIQKLRGGAIIIEKAGKLNSRTVKELNHLMEKKTGEMLFVLEDQRKPLERLLTAHADFKKKFTSRLELPTFINDELVTFGQTYAKENGYKLDEMGILALYSRIDVMQREDHAVTVAEVKDIMDEAIEHSQKANVKHLARRVFGKSTDSSDRIILKEEDFKI